MSISSEQAKKNGSRGGRPKGKKSKTTLEKEAVLKAYRERVMSVADKLLSSQMLLASGQSYLYRIDTVRSGKGCVHCGAVPSAFSEKKCLDGKIHVEGKVKSERKKPVLVTSPIEIANYLDKLANNEADYDPSSLNDRYYYITAKEPDSNTIDSMLDRTFGKATQPVEGDLKGKITLTFDDAFTPETKTNSKK